MRSDQIKKGPERAPARSMLRATGLGDREIQQPMIAVVNTWSDVTPCNIHLRELGEHLKAGIREAGGTPFEFGGIVVTDGIRVKLSSLRGKPVVLYFYPRDNTPGCTAQACNLRDNYEALQKAGYVVLGISSDSEKSHQKVIEKESLPVSLIADEDKTVDELCGKWR